MKLSVLVATHNERPFIEQTLTSIAAQDLDNAEFIIADNASTDGTTDIIKQFMKSDARFKGILRQKNIGGFRSALELLDAAQGRYLLFVGGHDIITPGYVSTAADLLDRHSDIGMVAGMPEGMDEAGVLQGLRKDAIYSFDAPSPLERYLASVKLLYNCTCFHSVFRRDALDGIEWQETISADHVMISRILWSGKLAYMENEKFIRRYFSKRETSCTERITGEKGKELKRSDFYDFYVSDFKSIYKDDILRNEISDLILRMLKARFG